MNRRTVLSTLVGTSSAVVAGCVSGGSGYRTIEHDGESVPLAPLDDVYEWYEAEDSMFADARGSGQYELAHIDGAVLSTAPDGVPDDPFDGMNPQQRIVTYCDCPHSLAVQRGASLLSDGFENVYALDDGFPAWIDAGYPITQSTANESIDTYDVAGRTDADYAGEYVWISDPARAQHEIAQIDGDGSYEATIRFADLTEESVLVVETPSYTVEAPLKELVADEITE